MADLPQSFDFQSQPKLDSEFTKDRFTNQVVVITGGCGGIGSGFVHRFVNDGAKVAFIDLNETKGIEMQKELKNKAKFYKCDVTSQSACFELIDKIREEFGKINHLVNAVACFVSKGISATEKDWHQVLNVNVISYSNMSQACFPQMKKISHVENCSILHLSSTSAHQAQPVRWTYGASKGAVHTLTKMMALDLSKDKIRVNSLSPTWTWTPEVAKIDPQRRRDKCEDIAAKFHMLGKMGEVAEVAAAGVFLCSRDAGFITGTDLAVDGGYGAMGPEGIGESSKFAGTDY